MKYTQTLHLDVPPETAFAVAVDPEAQQSRFMKVEVVNETPDGVGTELRYYYQIFGMRLPGGTYKYSDYVPGKRFTWEFGSGVESLLVGGPVSSTITFQPAGDGTDMTVEPEFTNRIPVVNQVARTAMLMFWRRDLPKWKHEIEQRAKDKLAA
jgi:uncharacterized protein YndB with AHSA1/START domain